MSPRPNLRFGPPGVIGLALAVSALVWSGPSIAQSVRPFDLTWQAPPECPAAQEVERDITRLIGESSHERTVRASAAVTGSEDGWRVRVRMETGGEVSERSLAAPTCRALEKAVALVVAITIEPRAAVSEAPSPLPSPPPQNDVPPKPALAGVREPAPGLKGFAVIGPATEVGLLPKLGLGGELDVGLRFRAFSAELTGALYAPQSTNVKGSIGGRFTLVSVGIRACGRVLGGQIEVFGCTDSLVNRLAARGIGVTSPGSASTILVTFGLGPRIDVRLGPTFLLRFDVGASYAPGRANFVLDNVGRVYTATHVEVNGRLGLAAQF